MVAVFHPRHLLRLNIVVLVLVGSYNWLAFAESNPDPRVNDLKKVRSRIKTLQNSLGIIGSERNSIITQLQELEQKNGKIAESLKALHRQIKLKKQRLEDIDNKIRALRSAVKNHREILAEQMRVVYRIGQQDRLKIILNQETPNNINRLLVYYDYFNRQNLRQLADFQEKISAYDSLKNDHLKESKQLSNIFKRKEDEQQRLEKVRVTRSQVLEILSHELKEKGEHLSRLREDEQKLEKLIASINKIISEFPMEDELPFRRGRGTLEWPTKGILTKRFGSKRVNGRWDGVLIEAKEGSPVNAIARGRVVYSDWLRGYGLITILDHGDDFMTLYAYNESLYKEVGDWVEIGETVASVGRSGGRSKAGLYFEIRKNGKPVNPKKWCRSIRGRTVGYTGQDNLLYTALYTARKSRLFRHHQRM